MPAGALVLAVSAKVIVKPGTTSTFDLGVAGATTVYGDRTFSFVTKTPPASFLLKKAAGFGKDLGDFSLETVEMFYKDAVAAGYKL